ncbi:MAG: single-stranded DNA-binding protein [Bacteroidales bacterium]|nr:single-stranded DNA-binding protein [Bacteroidales bacterium]
MEFQNRIELRGIIGRADVNTFNSNRVCNFSVVTECSAVDRDGNSAVETTWFNVSAWNGVDGLRDLSELQKGAWVRVVGRLRVRKYTNQENEERSSTDILARFVELLPKEDLRMQPQRDY